MISHRNILFISYVCLYFITRYVNIHIIRYNYIYHIVCLIMIWPKQIWGLQRKKKMSMFNRIKQRTTSLISIYESTTLLLLTKQNLFNYSEIFFIFALLSSFNFYPNIIFIITLNHWPKYLIDLKIFIFFLLFFYLFINLF